MDGRDLRAYWSVVRARTRSSYGEVGQRGLRDLVRAESALAGSTTGEARAAAHAVGEARRGQTENVSTRRHFETVDLHNFQDVLMLESLRVNRAMVLDAFTGVAEVCASRPGMLANDRWDERDEDGHWQELPPMQLKHVLIDPRGVEGITCEGHAATLHIQVRRGALAMAIEGLCGCWEK